MIPSSKIVIVREALILLAVTVFSLTASECWADQNDRIDVLPTPHEVSVSGTGEQVQASGAIVLVGEVPIAIAELLAEDIDQVYDTVLTVHQQRGIQPGDIVIELDTDLESSDEGYAIEVAEHIHLTATGPGGFYAGTATLLQLASKEAGNISFPTVVIRDAPYRDFRAVMVDVKNYWHSLEDLKRFVDMCRFYKVRYLSLHTGEQQWIGALTDQLEELTPWKREQHRLYTKNEMETLIAYASQRGVYLFPHNECTPSFQHMREAMTHDYVQGDAFEGFADELDGLGAYSGFDGQAEERWVNLMKIAIARSIEQFAVGYPDGVLPFYHIGPVLGEGGMETSLASTVLGLIQDSCADTKMMFWNGPNARDQSLFNDRSDCIVMYYDDEFGQSDFRSYAANGWNTVNSAWSPLYIVGSQIARPIEDVYRDWNLFRQGSDGIPGGYSAVQWEELTEQQHRDSVRGGMLCTWEVPQSIHFERLRRRVPAFVEHAWNHSNHPYPKEDLEHFLECLALCDAKLSRYIGEEEVSPSPPIHVDASQGTKEDMVQISWRSGGGPAHSYRVYRSANGSFTSADLVADLPAHAQSYLDIDVSNDIEYTYWVEASNTYGTARSESFSGTSGTGTATVYSYESFARFGADEVSGEDQTVGWGGPWEIQQGSTEFTRLALQEEGLSYPDLEVSGGALFVQSTVAEQGLTLRRTFLGTAGADGTEMWLSYLVRPIKVGDGDMFVIPHAQAAGSIGKNWGEHFAIYTEPSSRELQADQTYLVVARISYGEGDRIAVWIDPPLDQVPSVDAAAIRATIELGNREVIDLRFQGYGLGEYILDELRLGTSWSAVGGRINPDDLQPPAPNPMTWIAPPSQQEDGSIYMQSVEARDESGVQYYFECTDGEGPDSGWQTDNSYSIPGLPAGQYAYRVRTRDLSANRNLSTWSFAGSVMVE